jgi:O-antigen ligase
MAVLLLWMPLPFASVVPWAHLLVQITSVVLLALAAVTVTSLPRPGIAAVPAAALLAVALLGFAQAASWPDGIVRMISPTHAALASEARAFAAAPPAATPLSLAPSASRAAALTWAAAAACMLAAALAATRRHDRRILAFSILAAGIVQVLLGASWVASRGKTIWGVEVPGDEARLRGTFVNSDHLALYLEMVLPIAFAWGWWAWRRARTTRTFEGKFALRTPPALVWVTLFVGLAFTGSRAGLVAAATGAAVQGALLAARARRWRLGAAGVLALVVGLGAVAAVGLQQGLGRWLATSQYELTWNERLAVYGQTVELWQRFPVTGSGLSTFREAFPLVRRDGLTDSATYWHAHNDYLEVLATTGVAGALVLGAGLVALVVALGRRLRDAERSEDRAAPLAALGAIAAVAVHSCFDFGLTMPANAATLAILCGAALARGSRPAHPA